MRNRILAVLVALGLITSVSLLTDPATTQAATAPAGHNTEHVIKPLLGKDKKPLPGQIDAKTGKALRYPPFQYNWIAEARKAIAAPGATQAAWLVSHHKPFEEPTQAGHSLWEGAVFDALLSRVEVGWTMEQAVCGQTTNPCFFVYSADQGVGQGYAGISNTHWVDNPNVNNINANTALAYTAAGVDPTSFYQYRIERTPAVLPAWQTAGGAGWQVTWKPQAGSDTIVGYFPDSTWATPFSKFIDDWSWLEVVATDDTPCSDAGSGVYGVSTTPSSAFKHVAMSVAGGPPGTTNTYDTIATTPSYGDPNAWRFWNNPADLDWIRAGGVGFAGPVGSTSQSAGTLGGC